MTTSKQHIEPCGYSSLAVQKGGLHWPMTLQAFGLLWVWRTYAKLKSRFTQKEAVNYLLEDISWNIKEEPSEARRLNEEGYPGEHVDLTETLFQGDISLRVYDRYGERTAIVPASGRTVGQILNTIHDFYRNAEDTYAKTHEMDWRLRDDSEESEENLEEFGWNVGCTIDFLGIASTASSPYWEVLFET